MKNLKKDVFLAVGMLISSETIADSKLYDERCWQATNLTTQKTINLLFRLYEKNGEWSFAKVQYNKNLEDITLLYRGAKEIEAVDGRPSHFRYYFDEMYYGKLNGKYTFDSQGANVWGFKYFPKNSTKPLLFKEKFIGDDTGECFVK